MTALIVGIAEFKISSYPNVITTLGLGSCVGVTLYDPMTKVGGLAHVMLPEFHGQDQNRAKYADTALVDIIRQLTSSGARRSALQAKMAGGANMFANLSNQGFLKIGERNIAVCREVLQSMHIPILAADTGGTYGRTIELHLDTGKLKIKTVGRGEKFL